MHVIFQPHRYTRTRDLMAEFATAFDDADTVQVLDIYAASEEPIAGVDAPALVRAVGRKEVQYAASFEEAVNRTVAQAADGDVIVTLGAGSVSQAAGMVLDALGSCRRNRGSKPEFSRRATGSLTKDGCPTSRSLFARCGKCSPLTLDAPDFPAVNLVVSRTRAKRANRGYGPL